jgi:hypothetical protein
MLSDPNAAHIARVRALVLEVVTARFDDMDCPECFEHLDYFADLILDGVDAGGLMPKLRDHLERCVHCREELEALLEAVRGLQ